MRINLRRVRKRSYALAAFAALAAIAATAYGVGCSGTNNSQSKLVNSRPRPLSEQRALSAPPARLLEIGGDCTQFAGPGCTSGVCLKTTTKRGEGYMCSKTCVADADCGQSFECSQLYPSAQGWFCLKARNLAGDGGAPPPVTGSSGVGATSGVLSEVPGIGGDGGAAP